jgi:hypothetical protein
MSTIDRGNQASYKCLRDGKRWKATPVGISKVNKYPMNFFQKPKILMNRISEIIHSDALV